MRARHLGLAIRLWAPAWVAWCAMAITAGRPATAGEGFGSFGKKTATITRTIPARVPLTGAILVKATSKEPQDAAVAQRLGVAIEHGLLAAGKGLTVDAARPKTTIEAALVQDQYAEDWRKEMRYERRQVGKDSNGRYIMEKVPVELKTKMVAHGFAVQYRVVDAATARELDSDLITIRYEKGFADGKDAPDKAALEDAAVQQVAAQLVGALSERSDRITVPLPKGSLDEAGRLAEAGKWSDYLAKLEAMPERKPEEDSYRQYAMGAACEALAYGATDPAASVKHLEHAADHYSKAVAANPQERLFVEQPAGPPADRVAAALATYRKLAAHAAAGAKAGM